MICNCSAYLAWQADPSVNFTDRWFYGYSYLLNLAELSRRYFPTFLGHAADFRVGLRLPTDCEGLGPGFAALFPRAGEPWRLGCCWLRFCPASKRRSRIPASRSCSMPSARRSTADGGRSMRRSWSRSSPFRLERDVESSRPGPERACRCPRGIDSRQGLTLPQMFGWHLFSAPVAAGTCSLGSISAGRGSPPPM
jgi:hypothetical protein